MAEENVLDQNKLIVTRLNAAACSGAVAAVADRAVDEHFAPDFVIHNTFPEWHGTSREPRNGMRSSSRPFPTTM